MIGKSRVYLSLDVDHLVHSMSSALISMSEFALLTNWNRAIDGMFHRRKNIEIPFP